MAFVPRRVRQLLPISVAVLFMLTMTALGVNGGSVGLLPDDVTESVVVGPFIGVYALVMVLTKKVLHFALRGLLTLFAPALSWWAIPAMGLPWLLPFAMVFAAFLVAAPPWGQLRERASEVACGNQRRAGEPHTGRTGAHARSCRGVHEGVKSTRQPIPTTFRSRSTRATRR